MKILWSSCIGLLAVASAATTKDGPTLTVQDLDYDENGKLVAHNLFYPADNPNCPATSFQLPKGFVSSPLAGKALHQVFPGYEEGSGDCPVACQDRGVDRAVAHAVMPHKQNLNSSSGVEKWFHKNCKQVEVCKFYHMERIVVDASWTQN